jgi:hypothetical protein
MVLVSGVWWQSEAILAALLIDFLTHRYFVTT